MVLAAGQIVNYDDIATVAILARGNRTSNKSFTTETGYVRIDNVAMIGGHSYVVIAANLRISLAGTVAATDHYRANIRYDDTGTAATTTSTEIGRSEMTCGASTASNDTLAPVIAMVNPSVDVLGSFLLTIARTAGAATVSMQADSPGINIVVIDLGESVTDTGVDI